MNITEKTDTEKAAKAVSKKIQLIVFKLAGEEYALPIGQIKEVVLTPKISRVPQTPDFIKGVANIRGSIIAIIDLEERFHLKSSTGNEDQSAHYTLVIESEEFKSGILVKEVPNTLTVTEEEIDNTSNIIQYSTLDQDCIKGIAKVGERMIILVDMYKMMELSDVRKFLKQ